MGGYKFVLFRFKSHLAEGEATKVTGFEPSILPFGPERNKIAYPA